MRSLEPFDRWADARLEPLRAHPVPRRVFTLASELADFSLIWHVIGTARGVSSDRRADEAVLFAGLLGAESALVNLGVKPLFRRVRPTEVGDARFRIRRPRSTSFPSGHASSGFFAATVLTWWGGKRTAPIWFGLATVVGTSRAVVRIHHASDVIAGAALGFGLGHVARRLLRSQRLAMFRR